MCSTNPGRLKVVQHNVRCWKTHGTALLNAYRDLDADVLLLNSTGISRFQTSNGQTREEKLRVPGYAVQHYNPSGELNDGAAIAVRKSLQFKFLPPRDGMLAVEIGLRRDKVRLCTTYLPPRRGDGNLYDILKQVGDQAVPTYMLTDLNAHHPSLGSRKTDQKAS